MSQAILTALSTKIALSDVVGGFAYQFDGNVYLDKTPPEIELPVCVYTVSTIRNLAVTGNTEFSREIVMRVVFSMFAKADTTSTLGLAQTYLYTLLHGVSVACAGHDRVIFTLVSQGVPRLDDDAWSVEDEYEIRASRK